MLRFLFIIFLFYAVSAQAQTTAGTRIFDFLHYSGHAQATALGGTNISHLQEDIGMIWQNPALLRAAQNGAAELGFSAFYGGIKQYALTAGFHIPRAELTAAIGINYFDYGTIDQTDIAGTIFGSFHPADYIVQATVSRQYESRWHYGINLKYIGSEYGPFRSNGLAIDAGITYTDSAKLLQAGITLKHMGWQINPYAGAERDALPFDLQIGISKKLANAPVQFSLTAHRLSEFPLKETLPASGESRQRSLTERMWLHLIMATQVTLANRVELTLAYHPLRRNELIPARSAGGFTGLSFGAGVLFNRLKIRYAAGFYQANTPWHQLGLGLRLQDFL